MNVKLIGLLKVASISLLSLAALALFSGEGKVSSSEGEVQPSSPPTPPTPPINQLPLVIEDIPLVIEPEVCEGGACVPSSTSQNCQPTSRRRFFQRFFRR